MAIIKLDNVSMEAEYLDEKRIVAIFPPEENGHFTPLFINFIKSNKNVEWVYVNLNIGTFLLEKAFIVVMKRK